MARNTSSALADAYAREVRSEGREPRLLAAASFLLAFVLVRLVTHAIRNHLAGADVVLGSIHVHHMVPGLVLLLGAGVLDLLDRLERVRAVLFGIGAALVLDEFALILNLADVYWQPAGRESIDAVIVFGALLAVVALGGGLWRAVWHVVRDAVRRV